jgi:plasmid replication initiation protein
MGDQLLLPNILDSADGIVSHAIVMAKKKGNIGSTSVKTLAWMFAQLNKDKDIFAYSISRSQFKDILCVPQSSLKREINKVCNELSSHFIKIEDDKYEDFLPIAAKARFNKETGDVEFKFNTELNDFLTEIKRDFSKYKLNAVLSLSSNYAFYMFLLAKRFLHSDQAIFNVDVSLDELKDALGCSEKYTQYSGFRNKVLEPVAKEFQDNSKIDISFSYDPLKTGNKVTHLKLVFVRKPKRTKVVAKKKPQRECLIDDSDLDLELNSKIAQFIEENSDELKDLSQMRKTARAIEMMKEQDLI